MLISSTARGYIELPNLNAEADETSKTEIILVANKDEFNRPTRQAYHLSTLLRNRRRHFNLLFYNVYAIFPTLFMAALRSRCGHYIFFLRFLLLLLSSFFLYFFFA